MLSIRLEGRLEAAMSALSRAMAEPDWLFRFGLVSSTAVTGGFTETLNLGGIGQLTMPASGSDVLAGNVGSVNLGIAPIGAPTDRVHSVFVEGVTLDAGDVFGLVRRVPGGAVVTVDARPLTAALNAESCRITGSDGADTVGPTAVLRLARADLIDGKGGRDEISAGGANDTVLGGGGADSLYGQSGDDRLNGGTGDDRLTGGAGADVFVLARGTGRDRVTDFQVGIDRIDIDGAREVRDAGRDTIITVGRDSIVLVGVDRADIGWSDFI